MFLHHSLVGLQSHQQNEKVAATPKKASSSSKRARSPSPEAAQVAFFKPTTFVAVWSAITQDVTAHLSTGARGEGAESEWIRWALLVRAVEATASAQFQSLRQQTHSLASSLPLLPIPLTLRTSVQDRAVGVTHVAQLWNVRQNLLKQVQLERMLVELEGDLTVRDTIVDDEEEVEEDEEGEDDDDEDGDADSASDEESSESDDVSPPTKKSKRTAAATDADIDNFDSFGAARDSSLFFIDSSVSAADGSVGDAAGEEVDVGRSMDKILQTITPQAISKPVKKASKAKATDSSALKSEESESADPIASVDSIVAEAAAAAAAESSPMETDDAESGDVVADAPIAAEPTKRATRAKKESTTVPETPSRSTRAAKKRAAEE